MDLSNEDFEDASGSDWQLSDGQQVEYQLDDDEVEWGKEWGARRNASYSDGEDRRNDWGDNGGSASMARGTIVEMVLSLLYDECDFDTEISASGDGGIDGSIEIDGEMSTYDVKAGTADDKDVPFDVELLVAKHTFDRPDTPDIFVSAFVDEDMSTVRLRGWATTSDVLDATEKDAYAGSHTNYAIPVEDLEAMPAPTDLSPDGASIVDR